MSSVSSMAPARPSTTVTARTSHHGPVAATMPAVPASATAPAEAAPPGIAAPIEAGTAPAVVVPAVISSTEDELGLLDIGRHGRRHDMIDGHRLCRSDRAEEGERSCGEMSP